MARLLQAISRYGPRVARKETAQLDEVAQVVARGTGLTDSQVTAVLMELHKAILTLNRRGRAVKLPGIGIIGVSITRDGRRHVSFSADPALKGGLNDRAARTLPVKNAVPVIEPTRSV